MSRETIVASLAALAGAVAMAGLMARGRWRGNLFFTAYVGAALAGNLLVTSWPDQFHVWWFWRLKQAAYDLLRLGVALEVTARTVGPFPGARRLASALVLGVLGVTAGLMLTSVSPSILAAIAGTHARIVHGTVWVIVALLAVARWCRIPIDPFRRTVVVSLGSYMGLLAAAMRFEGVWGWRVQPYVNAIEPAAYLAVACWWAARAIAPEDAAALRYRHLLQRLSPRLA